MRFNFTIKTAEELYHQLMEKWLVMDRPPEKVIHFLTHHSYFQFMLYFKKHRNSDHRFLEWTKFSTIRNTYIFDQKLRLALLYYISEIENSFKNIFCQEMCQKKWNIRWTERINFKDVRAFDDILQPIIESIDNNTSKSDYIKKYTTKYQDPKYPPFWNMLELLSFGQISLIYKSVEEPYKKRVAWIYSIDNSILENRMQCLVAIRNICCHHNRLYNCDNLFPIKIPKRYKWQNIFEWNERNLFGVFAIIYYILVQLNLDKKFISEIKILLQNTKILIDLFVKIEKKNYF